MSCTKPCMILFDVVHWRNPKKSRTRKSFKWERRNVSNDPRLRLNFSFNIFLLVFLYFTEQRHVPLVMLPEHCCNLHPNTAIITCYQIKYRKKYFLHLVSSQLLWEHISLPRNMLKRDRLDDNLINITCSNFIKRCNI